MCPVSQNAGQLLLDPGQRPGLATYHFDSSKVPVTGLLDINAWFFFPDFNKNSKTQCKPYESSFSDDCPPGGLFILLCTSS